MLNSQRTNKTLDLQQDYIYSKQQLEGLWGVGGGGDYIDSEQQLEGLWGVGGGGII